MTTDGPSPSRIIAAAASASAGIGLVALLAGTAPPTEIVVEVEPTPVVVQTEAPARRTLSPLAVPATAPLPPPDPTLARPVASAETAPATTEAPRPVATTEGS